MFYRKAGRLLLIFVILGVIGYSFVFAKILPKNFPFDKKDALDEWEEKIFKGRVLYSVKVEEGNSFLTAYSERAASGIFYNLRFSPKENPMISWRWKVMEFPKKGGISAADSEWIEKDDYAARLYVIFPRLYFSSTKALEYIWDKDLPEGTVMTSPHFKNIKLIVVESGERTQEWVYEERNIYEDFKSVFGEEPTKVGAIAIMTDTDNTISTAEAHYDEIKVGYRHETE